MSAAMLALAALMLTRGAPNVTLEQAWAAVFSAPDVEERLVFLIRDLRVPRVLLAVVCGGALGMAGTLMQDALRNPLADPGLLGVSQAASFFVALGAMYPEVTPPLPRPVLCLIAGTAAGATVVLLAGSVRDPVRVVLTGAVLAALITTLTTVLVLLTPAARAGGFGAFVRYVTGSVSAAEWSLLQMALPWLVIGIPAALLCGRVLNLLQLGDEMAASVGLNPMRTRLMVMAVAMVLVSPVIAAIGPVAFVALFAPHVARGVLRSSDARIVVLMACVVGMTLLLAADTVGRLLFFPLEIPAGVWTVAAVGPAAIVVAGRLGHRGVA
jgi:iron complex transport system permease protein